MSDTPESDKAKIAFTSLFANDDAYWVPFKVSCKLERERDRLAEALWEIADCDFVITLPDRMDAVRAIAREALGDIKWHKL